jgi:soluble lytic murein transglycosylase-like protein
MEIKNAILTSVLLVGMLILVTSVRTSGFEKSIESPTPNFYKSFEIESPTPIEMYENLEKYSEQYEIPKYVFYNIAFLETTYRGPFDWDYNPEKTSCVGALGPMQIMPSTANMICGKKVPQDELKTNMELNIEISAKLLKKLYDKYKDWKIVCGCYNTGKPIVNNYAIFCSTNKNYQSNWVMP